MRIGLIDADGHHFPNLALMRISAYHKSIGDAVEWWMGDLFHYDIIYKSKIFSEEYSPDSPDPVNCDRLIKGGTGYAIHLENGKEVFDKDKHQDLPEEIERMFPDYSIYPEFDFAVSMTSRGCPRGCSFCHVASKEGRCSRKVADVSDFWNGQKHIEILDPNITACKEKRELFRQYMETGATLNFNQGLDMRFINDDDIRDINRMRIVKMHFAWDNPKDDLEGKFRYFADHHRLKRHGMVYCLTNFNSTLEEDLRRIYILRDLGYDPFVMVYNKPSAPREIINLQRWCNNKFVFKKVSRFEDYLGSKHYSEIKEKQKNGGLKKMIRNIDTMYYNFGFGDGYCHECEHFRRECWNKKTEKKIIGYDEEGKEIVELMSSRACGLKGKNFPKDYVTENQISMDDLLKGEE